MKWSYSELMDLPADLYTELVDWLNEHPPAVID
jgi:hypothetical protein